MRARVNFRLLSYNIWKGGAGRVDEIAAVIARCRPDVALLQEATRPEVVSALAERTGMTCRDRLRGSRSAI